jgi:hypothetical protein
LDLTTGKVHLGVKDNFTRDTAALAQPEILKSQSCWLRPWLLSDFVGPQGSVWQANCKKIFSFSKLLPILKSIPTHVVVTADCQVSSFHLFSENHGLSHCICGMTSLMFAESLEFRPWDSLQLGAAETHANMITFQQTSTDADITLNR